MQIRGTAMHVWTMPYVLPYTHGTFKDAGIYATDTFGELVEMMRTVARAHSWICALSVCNFRILALDDVYPI